MESVILVKQFGQTFCQFVVRLCSAIPCQLAMCEGVIEKQSAYIFPQLGTNIIQMLLFSFNSGDFNSGDGGKGV
jgi:hypothetical protein